MPDDTIVSKVNLDHNWDTVDHEIRAAKRRTQSPAEVWCVVSFDGVYMGTVWSRRRTKDGPTNHAEERFFSEYSLNMISDFMDKFGRFPSVLRLSIKYSPCNKRNDDRDDRCTFKIADDKKFWPTIQIRYERPYTNPEHDMQESQQKFQEFGISSGRI